MLCLPSVACLGSMTSCLLYLGSITCSTKVFAVCQDAATEYRHHNGGFGLLSPIAPVVHYYYKN